MADYTPDYTPLDTKTKTQVRAWMAEQARYYANSTLLAEACGDDLGLSHGFFAVIPEDVYEIAMDFYPLED